MSRKEGWESVKERKCVKERMEEKCQGKKGRRVSRKEGRESVKEGGMGRCQKIRFGESQGKERDNTREKGWHRMKERRAGQSRRKEG